MLGNATAAIFLATRGGLFCWRGHAIVPIVPRGGGTEPVTALAPLPGGRIVAATAGGRLLHVERDGGARYVDEGGGDEGSGDEPITSLLCVPAPGGHATLLAGTSSGHLLESDDLGATFRRTKALVALVASAASARLHVVAIPGRPRSALLLLAGHGAWLAAEPHAAPEPWFTHHDDPILEAVPHPTESHLWLARTTTRLLRSTDSARTFRDVSSWPGGLRPRTLHFATTPPHDAFVLAWPPAVPPDPSDPSSLWLSRDTGLTFHAVPSRAIDRARDPSGELTALATLRERHGSNGHDASARTVVLLATDRGELLEYHPTLDSSDRSATLLADALPPIDSLLVVPAGPALDPSTSGVYILP